MIEQTHFVLADGDVPYRNQAVEEYLMRTARPETCVLYLWQNRRTVVIGRNQNARAECRTGLLQQDGGYLARRLSGGGAVFHDLGNINFSFLAADGGYSVPRQLAVIVRAVRSFGLQAEVSGRNDITVQGRKFSGNAFMRSGARRCHHGTLLISADTSDMARYLSVDPKKLQTKGVRSVRSRVVNLGELNPAITTDSMTRALREAFDEEYGLKSRTLRVDDLPAGDLARMMQRFASEEWRLGAEPDYSFTLHGRFDWGGAELCLRVSHGSVAQACLFTDAMDAELAPAAEDALLGCPMQVQALRSRLAVQAELSEPARSRALLDISSLITEVE